MDVKENTERFIEYFNNQITAIQEFNISEPINIKLRLYKKVLLITLIDCLAGIRFKRKLNHKKRFIGFIKELNCWLDGDRISTPFLLSCLEKNNLNGSLLKKIRDRNATFKPDNGNIISLTGMDFFCDELLPLTVCDQEKKAINLVNHWSLLYQYRNYLIHEFREPGYGFEDESDDNPFYHGYKNDNKFYLTYPINFFENIAKKAIEGIGNYFQKNEIDPYSRVTDTSRWYIK